MEEALERVIVDAKEAGQERIAGSRHELAPVEGDDERAIRRGRSPALARHQVQSDLPEARCDR